MRLVKLKWKWQAERLSVAFSSQNMILSFFIKEQQKFAKRTNIATFHNNGASGSPCIHDKLVFTALLCA